MSILGIRQVSSLKEILDLWVTYVILGTFLSIPAVLGMVIWRPTTALGLLDAIPILLSGGFSFLPNLVLHEYSHALAARILGFSDVRVNLALGTMSFKEVGMWHTYDRDTMERLWRKHVLAIFAGPCLNLIYTALFITAALIAPTVLMQNCAIAAAWISSFMLILSGIVGKGSDGTIILAILKRARELRSTNTVAP